MIKVDVIFICALAFLSLKIWRQKLIEFELKKKNKKKPSLESLCISTTMSDDEFVPNESEEEVSEEELAEIDLEDDVIDSDDENSFDSDLSDDDDDDIVVVAPTKLGKLATEAMSNVQKDDEEEEEDSRISILSARERQLCMSDSDDESRSLREYRERPQRSKVSKSAKSSNRKVAGARRSTRKKEAPSRLIVEMEQVNVSASAMFDADQFDELGRDLEDLDDLKIWLCSRDDAQNVYWRMWELAVIRHFFSVFGAMDECWKCDADELAIDDSVLLDGLRRREGNDALVRLHVRLLNELSNMSAAVTRNSMFRELRKRIGELADFEDDNPLEDLRYYDDLPLRARIIVLKTLCEEVASDQRSRLHCVVRGLVAGGRSELTKYRVRHEPFGIDDDRCCYWPLEEKVSRGRPPASGPLYVSVLRERLPPPAPNPSPFFSGGGNQLRVSTGGLASSSSSSSPSSNGADIRSFFAPAKAVAKEETIEPANLQPQRQSTGGLATFGSMQTVPAIGMDIVESGLPPVECLDFGLGDDDLYAALLDDTPTTTVAAVPVLDDDGVLVVEDAPPPPPVVVRDLDERQCELIDDPDYLQAILDQGCVKGRLRVMLEQRILEPMIKQRDRERLAQERAAANASRQQRNLDMSETNIVSGRRRRAKINYAEFDDPLEGLLDDSE
jgi:hypothetical protein